MSLDLSDEKTWGPTFGLTGDELALWRCYSLTGADVSGGPWGYDWKTIAICEVQAMREAEDRLAAWIEENVPGARVMDNGLVVT